ncbi:MAG: metallophosphoesterase [Actinomycetota bacterium]|jgi:hypothetical protein
MGHIAPVPATTAPSLSTDTTTTTDPPHDPVLIGAGDIAHCPDRSGARATAAILDRTPGTVFTLGDNVYVDGTPAEFARCYAPDWGRHKGRTAFAVAGNHEYNTPGAAGHYGYFGAAAGDPARGYYARTVGAWQVIVLNSNCEEVGGCGAGSPQERWLRSVLAASDARCTVALWHHPAFSSATVHRAFPTYQPFWQALYDHGADVVLVASDHVYERFGPQTPTGEADPDFGLRQFTVGTGGRSHQLFKTVLPNSEVRNGATFGVLALTLHADGYDWRFIPEEGKTFTDSGTAACHGAPAPRPADPGPIRRVGSSSNASAREQRLTLARPAGTAPGDVMVASVVGSPDGGGFIAPEGWSVVRNDAIRGKLRQTVYLKVAGPAEPDLYIWSLKWRGRVAGGLTTYSGVDPAAPVVAVAGSVWRRAGGFVTAPSIRTGVRNAVLVHFAAVNAEGTVAPPEGMTQRWLAASPGGDARDALAASFDATLSKTGATGPRAARATERGARIGVVLALRPAP